MRSCERERREERESPNWISLVDEGGRGKRRERAYLHPVHRVLLGGKLPVELEELLLLLAERLRKRGRGGGREEGRGEGKKRNEVSWSSSTILREFSTTLLRPAPPREYKSR